MSTNGAYGFYKNGVTKVTYNHCDSYPTWLGDEIVNNFCRVFTIAEMIEMFDRIVLVDDDTPVTPDMIDIAKKLNLVNTSVGENKIDDFYCLFHNAQGNLAIYSNPEMKWMDDWSDFLQSSIFCEWAYIINLDTNMLEVYTGHVLEIPVDSRYYNPNEDYEILSNKKYYCVKPIAEFPLDGKLESWDSKNVEGLDG